MESYIPEVQFFDLRSDAFTSPELFRVYLRRLLKFRRNIYLRDFLLRLTGISHIAMGSFQYERYWKLGLKRVNSTYLARQFRRVSRPIIKNGIKQICGKNINISIPHPKRNLG